MRLVGEFVYCAHARHRGPVKIEDATRLPDGRYVCRWCDATSADADRDRQWSIQ